MVEIRRLQPLVKLQMPSRPVRRTKYADQRRLVRRTIKDFPPPTPQPTPCILWQGGCDPNGYGRMKRSVDGKWQTYAMHRWVVETALGIKLTSKQFVLHACDNPPCYRFEHLSVGTVVDNNADMKAKGRNKKPPVQHKHRDINSATKITTAQVREIKTMTKQGWSIKMIAHRYGVNTSTIYRINHPPKKGPK